jgi:3-deoxy-7-phosphoheptulonate synthase
VLSNIIGEVRQFFAVLREHGIAASGLHLETTPDPVLECVGSTAELNRHLDRYTSACDPRLNADQALAVVAVAAEAGWDHMVPTELTA